MIGYHEFHRNRGVKRCRVCPVCNPNEWAAEVQKRNKASKVRRAKETVRRQPTTRERYTEDRRW